MGGYHYYTAILICACGLFATAGATPTQLLLRAAADGNEPAVRRLVLEHGKSLVTESSTPLLVRPRPNPWQATCPFIRLVGDNRSRAWCDVAASSHHPALGNLSITPSAHLSMSPATFVRAQRRRFTARSTEVSMTPRTLSERYACLNPGKEF